MKHWRVIIKVESNEGDSFARVSEPLVLGNPLFFANDVEKEIRNLHYNIRKSIVAVYGDIDLVREGTKEF